MDPIDIIREYYTPGTTAYEILLVHSTKVAEKAVETAKNVPHLNPDLDFIESAAMLHDIGIFKTNAPDIGCLGTYPYICHGYLGREIIEEKGLKKHALVCERHTGLGLTLEDILQNNLPLPHRDMYPVSLEEIIVCYADKFFSKNPGEYRREKSIDEILALMRKYGENQADRFMTLVDLFAPDRESN